MIITMQIIAITQASHSSLPLCLFDFLIQVPRLLEQSSKGNCLNEV